jgi:hypothetical protein
MKKFLPLLVLATTIAAAGSAAGLARSKDAPPAPVAENPGTPLERFCSLYWGAMSDDGSTCRFEQTFHFNLTHVGASLLVTPVPVIQGDSLSLLATDDALPVVGNREYPLKSFVAESEGYLSFRSASASVFSVQKVTMRRCFSATSGTIESVACPK